MGITAAPSLRIDKNFKLPARTKMYVRKPYPIRAIRMDIVFEIETSKGTLIGMPGEYLIQNSKGEYRTLSAKIFEDTYEEFRIGR